MVLHQVPHATQKTAHSTNAGVGEVSTAVVRSEKHQVHAQRVGSESIEVHVGVHHVASTLAHLAATADQQPVSAKAGEWLLEVQVAQVVQRHCDKAAVQQMQDRVLRSTDIHI